MRDLRFVEGVVSNLMIFRGVPPGPLAKVARQCVAMPAGRGVAFARQGEPLPGIFALAYGAVKLVLSSADKEERVVRLVAPGQTFGEETSLLAQPCRYDAIALVDSKLVVIPSAAIYGLMDHDLRFTRGMLVTLAERALELLAEVKSATLLRGAQRLASYLVSLAAPGNGEDACMVKLPVSKTVVAARLGIKKETLSRLLRELAEQGLIAVSRREISILDRGRLAQVARVN